MCATGGKLPVVCIISRKGKIMRIFKKTALFLAVLTVLSAFSVFAEQSTAASKFSDVTESTPYSSDIAKLTDAGILNGYEDGTFRPEGGVTRAEMCKMIVLTFNLTQKIADAKGFPDVKDTDWYKPYALAAQAAGIVNGYEDGTFRGSELITREQVCAILNRILKPYDLPITAAVNDKISDWAKNDVLIIVKNKIMPLESGNTFRATEVIKRYELANALAKYIVDIPEPVTADIRYFVDGKQYGQTDTVLVGEYADVPEDPKSADESMYFEGWRIVGTKDIVDPKISAVLKDTDYEAVFAKKTYNVYFYDGKTLLQTFKNVEHGAAMPAADNPQKTGYTFNGWSLTENGSAVAANYKITSETKFYALFEKKPEITTFTVRFYANDVLIDTQEVAKGNCANEPTDVPEFEGYNFAGWLISGDNSTLINVSSYKITKKTDFVAAYEEKPVIDNPNTDELMDKLNRGHDQLAAIRFTNDLQKKARDLIVQCMSYVIDDANNGTLITKEYVNTEYKDIVDQVETICYDEMSARIASDFSNAITRDVDSDVQDFLKEYFLDGKDISM